MTVSNYRIENLMQYFENNLEPDKHYYGVTHKNDDISQVYEVYFKDNKWLCRKNQGFQPTLDNWTSFTTETVEEYFKNNNLCLDHLKLDLLQNIIMRISYHEMMLQQIENVIGEDLMIVAKREIKIFNDQLDSIIKDLTKPKLEVIEGDKESSE